jgi:hypothetical protein
MIQIQPQHIVWLLETGEELERQCEFSTALKYYFAGIVYFAKLDNVDIFDHLPRTVCDFHMSDNTKLFETMCRALQGVAKESVFEMWAKAHPGVVLSEDFTAADQKRHLKNCLKIDEPIDLQHVCDFFFWRHSRAALTLDESF